VVCNNRDFDNLHKNFATLLFIKRCEIDKPLSLLQRLREGGPIHFSDTSVVIIKCHSFGSFKPVVAHCTVVITSLTRNPLTSVAIILNILNLNRKVLTIYNLNSVSGCFFDAQIKVFLRTTNKCKSNHYAETKRLA
jgi:hypothetical protein